MTQLRWACKALGTLRFRVEGLGFRYARLGKVKVNANERERQRERECVCVVSEAHS
jgi:hypothetical protein